MIKYYNWHLITQKHAALLQDLVKYNFLENQYTTYSNFTPFWLKEDRVQEVIIEELITINMNRL